MAHWRDAFRIASRQPFFTLLIVTMLTLGIGGATAMFSAVRGVLLKPLPYEQPEELVWMYGAFRLNDSAAISPPDFVDYRARNQVFESLGAMVIGPSMVTVAKGSGPERLNMASVSAGLITTLGVAPTVGRDFRGEEESSTAAQPVIISERLWREQFGASPDALGRTVRVDDKVRTIVGVMPAGFALPFDAFIRLTDPVDLYAPLTFNDSEFQVRRFHFLRVIGRLRPGVSIRRGAGQHGHDCPPARGGVPRERNLEAPAPVAARACRRRSQAGAVRALRRCAPAAGRRLRERRRVAPRARRRPSERARASGSARRHAPWRVARSCSSNRSRSPRWEPLPDSCSGGGSCN